MSVKTTLLLRTQHRRKKIFAPATVEESPSLRQPRFAQNEFLKENRESHSIKAFINSVNASTWDWRAIALMSLVVFSGLILLIFWIVTEQATKSRSWLEAMLLPLQALYFVVLVQHGLHVVRICPEITVNATEHVTAKGSSVPATICHIQVTPSTSEQKGNLALH